MKKKNQSRPEMKAWTFLRKDTVRLRGVFNNSNSTRPKKVVSVATFCRAFSPIWKLIYPCFYKSKKKPSYIKYSTEYLQIPLRLSVFPYPVRISIIPIVEIYTLYPSQFPLP